MSKELTQKQVVHYTQEDAEQIKKTLLKYRTKKGEASKVRRLAGQKADTVYRNTIKKGVRFEADLLKDFKDKAFKVALAEDMPPYSRGGDRQRPDTCTLTSEGVLLTWEAEHPNDSIDFRVTFEELCKEVE